LIEAAGVHAVPQDIEEFHHLNYFVDAPETVPTVVFGPTRSLAAQRTRELVSALGELGRPQLLITDADTLGPASSTLVLPAVDEFLAPVLHAVPAAMLAAFVAARRGTAHYRGHVGPWRGASEAGLVRNSFIDIQTR
jgi:glucosamine--fructose-6-phosphate aminotransferase (isomerizing)